MNAPFSIWSQFYNTHDPEDAILEFEKSGLTHIELSHEHGSALLERDTDHITTGKKFKEFLAEHGVSALQGHLAFPSLIVCEPKSFISYIVRQAELYSAIGIKAAVLHCDYMRGLNKSPEEIFEKNAVALREVAKRTEHIDITICLENLCGGAPTSIENILELIRRTESDKFGICLDTGHLNYTKANGQKDFILKAGKYLKALHIADNDGSDDQHLMPFSRGNVDWKEVIDGLREIEYDGIFNYEIPGESHHCPVELKPKKIELVRATYDYIMKM